MSAMAEAGILAEMLSRNGAVHKVPVAISLHKVTAPLQEQVTVGVALKVHPEGRAPVTALRMPVVSVGKKRAYSPPALTADCMATFRWVTSPKPATANSSVNNAEATSMNSNAAAPRRSRRKLRNVI